MSARFRGVARLIIALLAGWLISWLGVAVLIALSVAWPHNPDPRLLLGTWAFLVVICLAITGGRGHGDSKIGWPVLVLYLAFLPFALAAIAIWPRLPKGVQAILEGNFRRHRRAKRLLARDDPRGAPE
jgi:uncharacterized SAM-binding protein YcdF (DUF218 family)